MTLILTLNRLHNWDILACTKTIQSFLIQCTVHVPPTALQWLQHLMAGQSTKYRFNEGAPCTNLFGLNRWLHFSKFFPTRGISWLPSNALVASFIHYKPGVHVICNSARKCKMKKFSKVEPSGACCPSHSVFSVNNVLSSETGLNTIPLTQKILFLLQHCHKQHIPLELFRKKQVCSKFNHFLAKSSKVQN